MAELVNEMSQIAHLTDGVSSLLIVISDGMPSVVHWGAPLGDPDRRLSSC